MRIDNNFAISKFNYAHKNNRAISFSCHIGKSATKLAGNITPDKTHKVASPLKKFFAEIKEIISELVFSIRY